MLSKPHKTARLSASMHPAQLLREGKATERDEHHCQRLQSELWVRISVQPSHRSLAQEHSAWKKTTQRGKLNLELKKYL